MANGSAKKFDIKSFIFSNIIGVIISVCLSVAVWYFTRYNLLIVILCFLAAYFVLKYIIDFLLGLITVEKKIKLIKSVETEVNQNVLEPDKVSAHKVVSRDKVRVGRLKEMNRSLENSEKKITKVSGGESDIKDKDIDDDFDYIEIEIDS